MVAVADKQELTLDLMEEWEWEKLKGDFKKIQDELFAASDYARRAMSALERNDPQGFRINLRQMIQGLQIAKGKSRDFNQHIELLKKEARMAISIGQKMRETGYIIDEQYATGTANRIESFMTELNQRINPEAINEEINRCLNPRRVDMRAVMEILSGVRRGTDTLNEEMRPMANLMNNLRAYLLDEQIKIQKHAFP